MRQLNRSQVNKFWEKRAKVADPRISTHFKNDDTHLFDLELINRYCNKDSEVLDVACGTCYLANALLDSVAHIKAIDKFPEFLKHCHLSDKLTTQVSDILTYEDDKKYDLILMFGIIMYFDEADTRKIYNKYSRLLKVGGKLIVKHQCGKNKDIYINQFSEQIGDQYQALYKWYQNDASILREYFKSVEIVNIYPARLNPWSNTHFYAFICSHPKMEL